MINIAIGNDHVAYQAKVELAEHLRSRGHRVIDFGHHGTDHADHRVYVMAVARAVAARDVERGIVIGESGVEIAVPVDAVEGARSCAVVDCGHAKPDPGRPANVLALGCRDIAIEKAKTMIDAWLAMSFDDREQAT